MMKKIYYSDKIFDEQSEKVQMCKKMKIGFIAFFFAIFDFGTLAIELSEIRFHILILPPPMMLNIYF